MKSYLFIAACVLLAELSYSQHFNINGQPIDRNGNYEAKVWEGTIIFKEGKNYGMKTAEGKVLLEPVYQQVRHFGYGIIGARKRVEGFSDYDHETKEPYMFYKATGEPISSKGYFLHDDYDGFSYGGMVIADDLSTDAKRGLLLSTGVLVTPRYQRVNDNVTVYRGVINGPPKGQYFAIDKKTGKETLLPYDDVLFFQHGLAAVKSGDKYGFVDETGKPVIPLQKLNYAYGFVTKNFGAVTDKKREDICIDRTGKQVGKPHKNFLQWWHTSKYGFTIVLDKELGLANVTDAYNDTESGFIYNVMTSKEEGYVSRACLNLVKKGSYYTLFGSTGKVITDSIVNIETDFNAKHGIVGALNKVYDYEGNLIKTVAKNHTCSAIDPIAISCGEKAVPVNKIVYSTSSNEPESKTYCVAMVLQQPGTMFGYFTEFESDSEYKLTDLIDIARSEKYKYNNLGSMKEIYILSDYGSCQDMKTKVYQKYSLDDFVVNTKYLK